MVVPISPRDFELLSAYLDGQIQGTERKRLEARLNQEDNLRKEYENLRHMRVVLRSLPRRRAPRNFTLTPQMAGVRSRPLLRLYPVMGFASALASLLFVLVVLGDFLGFFPGEIGVQTAQESAPQAMVLTSEVPQEAGPEMKSAAPVTADTGLAGAASSAPNEEIGLAPTETQSEFTLLMASPGAITPTPEAQPTLTGEETSADSLMTAAGGGVYSETLVMPVEAAGTPQPSETATMKMLGIGETPTPTLTFTPTPMPTETPVPTATAIDTPIPAPTETPQLKSGGVAAEQPLPSPTLEALAMGSEYTPTVQPEPTQDASEFLPEGRSSQPASIIRPLLLAQIGLLLLAVISGAAFLILRFKEH